jgi:hypothetical protein
MNTQQALFNAAQAPVIDFRGQLYTCESVKHFALAGNATITIRSARTNTRFTFRVRVPKEKRGNGNLWFVSLLNGKDNEHSYQYLGTIRNDESYSHSAKSKIGRDAPSAVAFNWLWNVVRAGRNDVLARAEIWHEGR